MATVGLKNAIRHITNLWCNAIVKLQRSLFQAQDIVPYSPKIPRRPTVDPLPIISDQEKNRAPLHEQLDLFLKEILCLVNEERVICRAQAQLEQLSRAKRQLSLVFDECVGARNFSRNWHAMGVVQISLPGL